jgi:3-deoxy-D-manno-octulosonic-acid transferase
MVSSKETLMEDISLLLADHQLRADMGENAKKVLTENAAALKNHIEEIKKCLC